MLYGVDGIGSDTWRGIIRVTSGVSTIYLATTLQQWLGSFGSGTGTRSGIIFPIMGNYTNNSLSSITIDVIPFASTLTTDDNIRFYYYDPNYGSNTINTAWLSITEIAR
jgi:hypothetical protein